MIGPPDPDPEQTAQLRKKGLKDKTKNFVLSAVVASSFAVVAFARGGVTGIVKERMDGMSAMGQTMKALAPMMRGAIVYDAEVVRRGAELIGSHAGETLMALFPEGSGGAPSEAKDAVWVEWDELFLSLLSSYRPMRKGWHRLRKMA